MNRAGPRQHQPGTPAPAAPSRRQALQRWAAQASAVTLGWWPWANSSVAAATRRPTPAQTEGPYYPVQLPSDTDSDLLQQGSTRYAKGQACWLQGEVVDLAGTPLVGAVVEIWQCDAEGHYRHPADGDKADPNFQAFGRATTDAQGRYRFRTLRPAPYPGRTPHIHVKVKQGRRTLLTTQVYVEGDPANAADDLWRRLRDPADRAALTVPFERVADGLRAEFNIVVAA